MLNTFVAVDIETTGLYPDRDRIIEIGAVKVENTKIVGEFSCLINPQMMISDKISSLTGITNEMLMSAKDSKKVLLDFLDFAGVETILGHNIIFDYSFLKAGFMNLGISYERNGIDTLKIARALHSDLDSKSLASMCNYYKITNEHAHRAFDDAKAAYELYYKLRNEFEKQSPDTFKEQPLFYKLKKVQQITQKQKNYLNDLVKCHKIELEQSISDLSKSEASRLIDKIILAHGRIY